MPKSHVPPDTQPKALLEYLDSVDAEAKAARKDRETQWERSLKRFGQDYIEDMPTPIFRANLINPLMRRMAALLTEMKPKLDVQPTKEGLTKTTAVLKATIEANWDEQNVGITLNDIVLRSLVLSSAFAYIGWDAEANYGLGNVSIVAGDPRDYLVDPAIRYAQDLDHAQYLRTRSVVPLPTAQRLFPDVADELKPCGKVLSIDKDNGATQLGSVRGSIESAIRRLGIGPGNQTALPRVELFEYYLADPATTKDGSPIYPNGRVVIRANDDVICRDGPNIYYDGRWPFEWLDNEPDLNSAWGRDEISAIRHINLAFNRLGNTATTQTLLNAIPFMVADKNTLDDAAINTLRTMGYYVLEATAGRRVERQAAAVQIATIVQYMQYMQNLCDNLLGLQDAGGNIGTSRGRAEVRSAPMLEGLQQAGQVLIRAKARRLESFLERLGQKWVSRIFQFYTQDRLMTFIGDDGTWQKYKFEREQLQAEILRLGLERMMAERKQQMDREKDDAVVRAVTTGDDKAISALTMHRNVMPLPVLGKDEVLASIKGAWRDFRFHIEPYSSLASNRTLRAQLYKQLADDHRVPGRLYVEEVGIKDPQSMQQEALEEERQRQAAGIQPPQPAKGQKKKS